MTGMKKMGGIIDRLQMITANGYFLDKRFDYTSGDLDYSGINEIHDASVDLNTWIIWKYTWADGNLVRIEGPLEGSWTGRAALSWGA